LTTKRVSCRKYKSFLAGEAVGIVVVLDLEVVSTSAEVLVYDSVKLSEVRETSSAHPHYKVFYKG